MVFNFVLVLLFCFLSTFVVSGEFVRGCYFTSWSNYDTGAYQDGMCTHLFYAFATINEDFTVGFADPNALNPDPKIGTVRRMNDIKKGTTNPRTLISIGGWGEPVTTRFRDMAGDNGRRKKFVDSAIKLIREQKYDGIDIDWEFPKAEDKGNFAQLMEDLQNAMVETEILTAAVEKISDAIDVGYDIPRLAKSLNYLNVMTYDYHGNWEKNTGFNAPLHGAKGDLLSVEWSMNYWRDHGFPKEKIVMGIPAYGKGWTLSSGNTGIGAPASGPSNEMSDSKEKGTAFYRELCGWKGKYVFDDLRQVPYVFKDNQWFGYDDQRSIDSKTQFIKDQQYAGAFVWSMDGDDYKNACGAGSHPLLNQIRKGLL